MDLFAYVNSKFVYVERHHRDQLEALYHSVLQQRCNLEQQVIRNALALAAILPDVFAYTVMKKPGYMAVIGGEVAHIIKCTPVPVKVRHAGECYRELPVTYQNTSMFLKPKSRILVSKGTEESCSALLPQEYLVEGVWYQLLPKPTYVKDPQILEPDTEVLWKYTDAGSLATSGIYTQADLDNLRDHVMFPIEQPSILNNIARGATGQKVQTETLNFMNFVSKNEFNKFAESVTSKVWNGLLKFGSVSAAILGVIFIFKIIKLVVDSILRGYALHTVYGWSIHLLGAIWGSITGLLLQLKNSKDRRAASTETELREITTEQSETVNSLADSNQPTTATSSSQTEESPGKQLRFYADDEILQKFRSLRSSRK
ncbi:uncharacterized protein LOC122514827 [Polistes fuscatus]|uniref:uncharacterized protein LOC122514827 n=1 Tax=Polistes fuscatus TaxID=30207 RepID=UPI001CA8358A|nr:uncharacterized protein LOC122514827 [Polistes fuscatus]